MLTLTRYLQERFQSAKPKGWDADVEVPLFDGDLRRRLGFQAKCDVRFHQPSTGRSIWVELEISRADPVANHVKFAVGHVEGRLDRNSPHHVGRRYKATYPSSHNSHHTPRTHPFHHPHDPTTDSPPNPAGWNMPPLSWAP